MSELRRRQRLPYGLKLGFRGPLSCCTRLAVIRTCLVCILSATSLRETNCRKHFFDLLRRFNQSVIGVCKGSGGGTTQAPKPKSINAREQEVKSVGIVITKTDEECKE